MKKIQQGFTLIELMIVVAIIGILAAIAIPQYQNYIINSKLSAAASSVASVETAMANDFQTNGSFPSTQTLTGEGFNIVNPHNGDTITITGSGTVSGVITYTFSSAIGSGVPANSSITFTATPNTGDSLIKWVAAASSTITNTSATAYIQNKLNGS